MKMPSKLSTWFMILYFLFVGLSEFVPAANIPWLIAVFALGAAATILLGR